MLTLMRGTLGIHDPSTVITCQGRYYVFGTGQNIISRSSADKQFWVAGPTVFNSPPAWTTNAAPGFDGTIWAPEVIFFNNQYHLYYAVSSFGTNASAIGLATNPTLDPSNSSYRWTDEGIVIQSTSGSPYNTIDPSVTFDAAGNLWMSFGSFWSGIYLVQLDPTNGKRISPNSPTYHLAVHNDGPDSIEASYIFRRGAYYYLFVNWNSCCAGVNSTYNVRVGRSAGITGPYVDQNGVSMAAGGGTLFLEGTGKYIGPGQVGILTEGGTNWFSYHYYDGNNNGAPSLDVEPLAWTSDNWPLFTNDWSAIYNFEADARDDNGQYYGLLQGGASVQIDPVQGQVLNLSGTNQFAQLPAGVGFGRTYSALVRWNGGAAWQRVFDFGQGTNAYLFLTPSASSGKLRFAITRSGLSGEQMIEGSSALPAGIWTHVAVTLDGQQGVLYLNGAPVATNASMDLSPLAVVPLTNLLGKSQFPLDPYFRGQIANFCVCGRVLSAGEVAMLNRPHISPLTTIASSVHWTAFYAFDNRAADANGQLDGTLANGATTPQVSARGGVLNLNGSSQYVSLPSGIGNVRTFAGWVNWNGGAAWQRIFDFGVDRTNYAFLTPLANSGKLRFGISSGEERWVDSPGAFPTGVWTHVAVALDGRQAVLFLNGRAIAVNNSINLLPSDILGNANYFGRSHFPDPYFNGQMDSLLLASDTLGIEQIIATPINFVRQGTNITMNWPALNGGLILQSASALDSNSAWSPVLNTPATTNGVQFLTLPLAGGARFFELQWPAVAN